MQAYAIEVTTKSRVWTVFRRYNDFLSLQEMVRAGAPVCNRGRTSGT